MKPLKTKIGKILKERLQMAKRRISEDKNEVQNLPSKKSRFGQASTAKGPPSTFTHIKTRYTPAAEERHIMTGPGSSRDNPIDLTGETKMDPNIAHGLKPLLEDGFDPQWAFPDELIKDISPSQMLQDYGRMVMSVLCKDCYARNSVTGPSSARTAAVFASEPEALCRECRIRFCFDCGDHGNDSSYVIHSGCEGSSRWMLLFSLLCGPDTRNASDNRDSSPKKTPFFRELIRRLKQRLRSKEEVETPSPKQVKPAEQNKNNSNAKTSAPTPAFAKGTGYDSGPRKPDAAPKKAKPNKESTYGIPNDQLEEHFKTLADVMPDATPSERPATLFDTAPEGQYRLLAAMISRSPLIFAALELLRNDCMEEMAENASLYNALLDFLDVVACREDTRWSLLVAQRLYPLDQQLLSVCTLSSAAGDVSALETTSSVALTLEKLARYCEFFESKAKRHTAEFKEGQGKIQLALARRIIDLENELTAFRKEAEPKRNRRAAIYLSPSGSASAQKSATRFGQEQRSQEREWLAKDAAAWHSEHRVEEIPDDDFFANYYFAADTQKLTNGSMCKGRMKKLITQLSSLKNSLPEGIYVRHASSRLDVLKALIVGPSGTPYEGGLFEFDIFCGADFPDKPPSMQFRTTGGGRVRFNPNLYPCGTVCLSLLGTWEGQNWIAGESTLEQLLVSIQGMVFCDNPWYNEPGYESRPDKSRSDNYNRGIQQSTTFYAMIHWLRDRLCQEEEEEEEQQQQQGGPTTVEKAKELPAPPPPDSSAFPEDEMEIFEEGPDPSPSSSLPMQPLPGWSSPLLDDGSLDPSVLQTIQSSLMSLASLLEVMPPPGVQVPQILTFLHPFAQPQPPVPVVMQPPVPVPPPEMAKATGAAASSSKTETKPAVCKEDDKIWGPVIRHHFACRGVAIMELVKKWEKEWSESRAAAGYSKSLEALLRAGKLVG